MFYLEWIFLIVSGLAVSLWVFFWGLRSGQFSDQERARFLPLAGEAPPPVLKNPGRLSAEVYVLLFILALGVAGMLAAVVLTILHQKG